MQDDKNVVYVDIVVESLNWFLINLEGELIVRKDICIELMEEFEVSKNIILDRLCIIEK